MLRRPILDLATHSLDWEPTAWESITWDVGLHASSNRLWISQRTHLTESLQYERLHAQATDSGSRNLLIGRGAYNLGTYMLKRTILELATHSLDSKPTIWEST